MIGVVDYGLGNLHSVLKALAHHGAAAELVATPAAVAGCSRLILPGVGAFADGMRGLRERGLDEALVAFAASGRPLAGICLGAQLLATTGEEFGTHVGLGIIPGRVVRIPAEAVKVPHVGWNRLVAPVGRSWSGTPLVGTVAGTWAYFVHSYHVVPDDPQDVLAVTSHGPHTITAAVGRGAITGFQFHPEKSGQAGLAMLRLFLGESL
ncbi:imidazole glycerol phosphate synthase subunit HisH 1 [Planctomycetota bacterium]|nr:imidazole glycerol phosphate synthase subunit HisH 1 [Planctomycetota bacterium]